VRRVREDTEKEQRSLTEIESKRRWRGRGDGEEEEIESKKRWRGRGDGEEEEIERKRSGGAPAGTLLCDSEIYLLSYIYIYIYCIYLFISVFIYIFI